MMLQHLIGTPDRHHDANTPRGIVVERDTGRERKYSRCDVELGERRSFHGEGRIGPNGLEYCQSRTPRDSAI